MNLATPAYRLGQAYRMADDDTRRETKSEEGSAGSPDPRLVNHYWYVLYIAKSKTDKMLREKETGLVIRCSLRLQTYMRNSARTRGYRHRIAQCSAQ